MKASPTLLLTALAALILTGSASAALVTLNPTQDAFVMAANSSSNYGGAGALGISGFAVLPNGEFDSLLQFNLAAAKASFDTTFGAGQWAINSITLQLTAAPPNNSLFNGFGAGPGGTNVNAAGQFSVKWMQNDSWTEGNGTPAASSTTGGITYSTLPSFLSGADQVLGTFAFGGGTSGNTTVSLSLASSFVADAAAGNAVSLLMLPADTSVEMLVNSRSVGTAASRPLLSVSASAVPEAGTFMYGICAIFAALSTRGCSRAQAQ